MPCTWVIGMGAVAGCETATDLVGVDPAGVVTAVWLDDAADCGGVGVHAARTTAAEAVTAAMTTTGRSLDLVIGGS